MLTNSTELWCTDFKRSYYQKINTTQNLLYVFIFGWENEDKQQLLCYFWTDPNLESIVSTTKERNLIFKMEQEKLRILTGNNKVMFSLGNSR